MKKQVVSFLALFGLVLVLSVYYVLLPTNLFINNKTNIPDLEVGVTIDESANLYFTTLQTNLEKKHNQIIDQNESIVASAEYANEEKEVALNLIDDEYELMDSETFLVGLIKEEGFANAYVEYQESIIKVIVQSTTKTNEEVATIMTLVMQNAIQTLLPEVMFVD